MNRDFGVDISNEDLEYRVPSQPVKSKFHPDVIKHCTDVHKPSPHQPAALDVGSISPSHTRRPVVHQSESHDHGKDGVQASMCIFKSKEIPYLNDIWQHLLSSSVE